MRATCRDYSILLRLSILILLEVIKLVIRNFFQPIISFLWFLFGLWGYLQCGHSWPIVPASGNSEDDCGEADEM
jgi:hypothetical protein